MTIDAPSATFTVRGRQWHVYHVCGAVGFVVAAAEAFLLTWALRLSPGVIAVAAIAGVAILFALTYVTTVILGREVIVNYHHMIAVSAVTALVAWTAGVPVVAHVAAFVVSLVVSMGFGVSAVSAPAAATAARPSGGSATASGTPPRDSPPNSRV